MSSIILGMQCVPELTQEQFVELFGSKGLNATGVTQRLFASMPRGTVLNAAFTSRTTGPKMNMRGIATEDETVRTQERDSFNLCRKRK